MDEVCWYCHGAEDKEWWVQCELCPQWVHVECIPMKCVVDDSGTPSTRSCLKDGSGIKQFTCHKHGERLILNASKHKRVKRNTDGNRYNFRNAGHLDYMALNEGESKKLKLVHPHIKPFLKCFDLYKANEQSMDYEKFVQSFEAIDKPYRIRDPCASGIKIPSPKDLGVGEDRSLTVEDITAILGDEYPVNVMDVQTQENAQWSMKEWNEYFTHTAPSDRERIKNVISLEVSHIKEFPIVRPTIVTEKDMVNEVWPYGDESLAKPKVTRYVLMSVAEAYTDFHIDFAGTSVYYNLISGRKYFLLFPPTEYNLKAYVEWTTDINQADIFLGDRLVNGVAIELTQGDLFIFPSGYIHAVYTPSDSLIIGGNFLTFRDLKTQLQVADIERKTNVPKKFRFPHFEQVMGRTCEYLLSPDCTRSTTKETLEALKQYVENAQIKYKPKHYSTKKALLKALEERLVECN